MSRTGRFVVSGPDKIHCDGCEQRVVKAMKRLPGVTEVAASAKTQVIVVGFDPGQVSPREIVTRLEQVGYQVRAEEGGSS